MFHWILYVLFLFLITVYGLNIQNYSCAFCLEAQELPDPEGRTVVTDVRTRCAEENT